MAESFFCPYCNKWFNESKCFKKYRVIICPACKEEGLKPLFPKSNIEQLFVGIEQFKEFHSMKQLIEIITEICSFIWQEIEPIFSTFEVIK